MLYRGLSNSSKRLSTALVSVVFYAGAHNRTNPQGSILCLQATGHAHTEPRSEDSVRRQGLRYRACDNSLIISAEQHSISNEGVRREGVGGWGWGLTDWNAA